MPWMIGPQNSPVDSAAPDGVMPDDPDGSSSDNVSSDPSVAIVTHASVPLPFNPPGNDTLLVEQATSKEPNVLADRTIRSAITQAF
jgi:hypothetical protein